MTTKLRWHAIVKYTGGSSDTHDFEECSDLGDVIERGLAWSVIDHIAVYPRRRSTIGRYAPGEALPSP